MAKRTIEGRMYTFELKYNKSVDEAMEQIYSRDYAGRFGKNDRKVYLIGANYVEKKDKRRLEYRIEVIPAWNDQF